MSRQLTLPNPLAPVRELVLDAVSSPLTRTMPIDDWMNSD